MCNVGVKKERNRISRNTLYPNEKKAGMEKAKGCKRIVNELSAIEVCDRGRRGGIKEGLGVNGKRTSIVTIAINTNVDVEDKGR